MLRGLVTGNMIIPVIYSYISRVLNPGLWFAQLSAFFNIIGSCLLSLALAAWVYIIAAKQCLSYTLRSERVCVCVWVCMCVSVFVCLCVFVCVRLRASASVRACMRASERACVRACVHVEWWWCAFPKKFITSTLSISLSFWATLYIISYNPLHLL